LWTKEEAFEQVVKDEWNDTDGCFETLTGRLIACGSRFKEWSDSTLGAIPARAKDLRKKFQELCEASPMPQNLEALRETEKELMKGEHLNECFWARELTMQPLKKAIATRLSFMLESNSDEKRI